MELRTSSFSQALSLSPKLLVSQGASTLGFNPNPLPVHPPTLLPALRPAIFLPFVELIDRYIIQKIIHA